jgi:hypothetical protein
MNGKIKVVGTNAATQFLQDQADAQGSLVFRDGFHRLVFKDREFAFDLKKSTVVDDFILLWGWLVDEQTVGQICLEFYPKNPLTKE